MNLGLREGCDLHRFRFDEGVKSAHNLSQISAVVEKIMASTFVAGRENMRNVVEQTVDHSVKTMFQNRARLSRTSVSEYVG